MRWLKTASDWVSAQKMLKPAIKMHGQILSAAVYLSNSINVVKWDIHDICLEINVSLVIRTKNV